MKAARIIVCILLAVLLVVGCSKKSIPSSSTEIELVDYSGRTVKLPKPAERIVVMADNSLVIVKQLKAIDRVVALDSKTKGYLPISILNSTDPDLNDLPDVGKTKSPNYELIISLSPDLILFKGDKDSADMLQEKTNVPVASILSTGDYDFGIYEVIGKLLGKGDEAETLIKMFTEQKSALEQKTSVIPEAEKKSAYIVTQNSRDYLFKTLKGSISLDLANIRNVAADANKVDEWGFADISKEEFLNYNPDLIFIDKPTSETGIHKETVMSDSTFIFSKAIKQGALFYTHSFSLPKDYAFVIAEAYYYAFIAYPGRIAKEFYMDAIDTIFDIAYGIKGYYEDWEKTLL